MLSLSKKLKRPDKPTFYAYSALFTPLYEFAISYFQIDISIEVCEQSFVILQYSACPSTRLYIFYYTQKLKKNHPVIQFNRMIILDPLNRR